MGLGFNFNFRRKEAPKELSPRWRFVFGLVFTLLGGLAAYFGSRDLVRAMASPSWPATRGVVTHSSVELRSGGRSGSTYYAEISYAFAVEAKTFTGGRVSFGDYGSSFRSHAQGVVDQYPEGREVTVHYKKEDPKICVIEPGIRFWSFFTPMLGLIFLAVGIMFLLPYPPEKKGSAAASRKRRAKPLKPP